jgi:hypothetical protein
MSKYKVTQDDISNYIKEVANETKDSKQESSYLKGYGLCKINGIDIMDIIENTEMDYDYLVSGNELFRLLVNILNIVNTNYDMNRKTLGGLVNETMDFITEFLVENESIEDISFGDLENVLYNISQIENEEESIDNTEDDDYNGLVN